MYWDFLKLGAERCGIYYIIHSLCIFKKFPLKKRTSTLYSQPKEFLPLLSHFPENPLHFHHHSTESALAAFKSNGELCLHLTWLGAAFDMADHSLLETRHSCGFTPTRHIKSVLLVHPISEASTNGDFSGFVLDQISFLSPSVSLWFHSLSWF